MEDDAGVKAPVTRLRRRLSVEQSEESKSPAVNTPTKRRARKKPELDLIEENTPDYPKTQRTRKTVKEATEAVEEKPVTPARRSTRTKSNTSIVSETAVAVSSPRAKRATRRASQVGSDNEAPPTPVRATRRTRKDSASSIDKVEVPPAPKPITQITEVIVEEPETNSRKSTNSEVADKQSPSPNSFRKSPRLMKKHNLSVNKTEDIVADQSNSSQKVPIQDKFEVLEEKSIPSDSKDTQEEEVIQNTQKDRLSISSSNLIRDLDTKGNSEKTKANLNKSTSVIPNNVSKTKRARTKSWGAEKDSKESNFFSDNESMKKKTKAKTNSLLVLNRSASGDFQNTSLNHNKSKNSKKSSSFVIEDTNKSTHVTNTISKDINEMDTDIQNQSSTKAQDEIDCGTSLLYKEPSGDIKTMVVIEDSDSNSGKTNVQDINDSGDQCVPVIEHPEQNTPEVNQFTIITDTSIRLNKSKNRTITDNSCEPMEVDETIPDSMVIADAENEEHDTSRKCGPNNEKEVDKTKSPSNENKSTLIVSHLKDTSVEKLLKPANKLLSKSAIDLDVTQENETNHKNLSLNYLTSTPLQHKSIQKLAMQVNTSIIASNNDSKHVIENLENNSEKADKSDHVIGKDLSNKENNPISNIEDVEQMDVSATKDSSKNDSNNIQQKLNLSKNRKSVNKIDNSDESDEDAPLKIPKTLKGSKKNKFSSITSNDSDDSENESNESNMLDDQAEDMGDDYESGDSQDENERQYEKENEIIERGETLTSENDDLSNDSDYEKDSFIVSSDEEDNELLEGTEDDLSMSDNELKMTAKSKKKYDERKLKEQKKASREMFESRHKITNKSVKTKNSKRQQLSSSEESSESEDESEKPKKINRMRLDSSHDSEEENISMSKKKTSRLSESICEEAANEKEITIANESLKENDPLSQIEEEPKTPLKNDNETIALIVSEDINYDKNESTKTQTELQDPLEGMDDDNEVSLSSENEEIMQNYDSMLNNLNKTNKTKTKTCDISLNLDKKSKKKDKNSVIDELNLTQVKSTRKDKNKRVSEIKSHKEEKKLKEDGESSDSIDIHLLFSEDSNDSEEVKKKNKKANAEDNFIPLKRTEAKSNILEDSNNKSEDISPNQSAKKIKKRKSQLENVTLDTAEDNNVNFFIDTEGTHNDTLNKSHNISLNSRKDLSISNKVNSDNSDSDEILNEEVAHNISKKEIKLSGETDSITNKSLNKSLIETLGSAKKKVTPKITEHFDENSDSDAPMEVSFKKEKQKSNQKENLELAQDETDSKLNKSLNKSLVKTPVSEKKKKMNKQNIEDKGESNTSLNRSLIKTPESGQKIMDQDVETLDNTNETFIEKSFNKSIAKTPVSEKKKKKSMKNNASEEIENVETSLNTSTSAKKKKKSIGDLTENNSVHDDQIKQDGNLSLIKTPGSGKKKKLSESQILNDNELQSELSLSKSMTRTPGSEKKKNKSTTHNDQSEEAAVNVFKIKTPSSVKKNIPDSQENHETNAKKRKRKSSLSNQLEENDGQTPLLNESLVRNQKKKRKITEQETATFQDNKIEVQENIKGSDDLEKVELPKKQKSKKRKERDEDEGNGIAKVSKANSFDKAPVSRLPTSLLQQLDDKPKPKRLQPQSKKPKLISTTQFVVEETQKRKIKPSNYLEESVYLDDDEDCERKQRKEKIVKPKVLPFVPTITTSSSGYTTTFNVNIIPKETKFVAQSSSVGNFKDDYLYNKKIKRQGTYELYKRNRKLKISKF